MNESLTLVPCIICERQKPLQCFLNIQESYPITVMIGVNSPTGLKPHKLQAYLCPEHYEEHKTKTDILEAKN